VSGVLNCQADVADLGSIWCPKLPNIWCPQLPDYRRKWYTNDGIQFHPDEHTGLGEPVEEPAGDTGSPASGVLNCQTITVSGVLNCQTSGVLNCQTIAARQHADILAEHDNHDVVDAALAVATTNPFIAYSPEWFVVENAKRIAADREDEIRVATHANLQKRHQQLLRHGF